MACRSAILDSWCIPAGKWPIPGGDPGREQRIVAGGTGKCCPRVSYASHKEMLEVELLV